VGAIGCEEREANVKNVHGVSASGLEDVVAASTRLSDVDGAAGRLVIAGAPVERLAGRLSFEEMVYLLWNGEEPNAAERVRVRSALGAGREAGFEMLSDVGEALALPDPMDALRAAMGHFVEASAGRAEGMEGALSIIGALGVIAAALARPAAPRRPDINLTHAADYLRMVTGAVPSQAEVDALDAYLVTVIDHGMNASTFAARVVASTASDRVSAVVAGLGALKGRLHGGAPGPVLDMLDAIGDERAARGWLESALASGERIMGMGHRVYRVRDPRADVLERALTRLESARAAGAAGAPRTSGNDRLGLARCVEREAEALLAKAHPERALRANVEFYTAVLLDAIGLPRTLFTPTFAVGRVAGWCAHVEEQWRYGRLIRPTSRYVGPATAPSASS
jgi:citrate synthase